MTKKAALTVYLERKMFTEGKPQLGNPCSDRLKFSPGHVHLSLSPGCCCECRVQPELKKLIKMKRFK